MLVNGGLAALSYVPLLERTEWNTGAQHAKCAQRLDDDEDGVDNIYDDDDHDDDVKRPALMMRIILRI